MNGMNETMTRVHAASRRSIRRIALATATAILLGSAVAAPASAAPAPAPGVWYKCQTLPAGYIPIVSGNATGWIWDGRLQWEACVAQTSSGTHYGIVRLSAPADLAAQYDRFTGIAYVYLQKCTNGSYTKVGEKYWGVSQYVTGTKVSTRYQFPWQETTATTDAASNYRLQIVTRIAAVVPRWSTAYYFSLQPNGVDPYNNDGVYTTGCMNP